MTFHYKNFLYNRLGGIRMKSYVKSIIGILCIVVMFGSVGCKKQQKQIQEPVVVQIEEPIQNPLLDAEVSEDQENNPIIGIPVGQGVNPLTGLWVTEEAVKRRPVAIMINNLHKALPHSGISQADLFYEVLAEGEITRIMAVFQEVTSKKIGPVRSARHYFLDFAFDHDAIYVHYGGSPQAFKAFKQLNAPNLNGLSYLDDIMCFRDKERMKQKGMYEHSLYTSGEGIQKAWDKVQYRTEKEVKYPPTFTFSEVEYTPNGETALQVIVPFSKYQMSEFAYDEEKKVYWRAQTGKPHVDIENGEQLSVKNIIIQFADIRVIAGDDAGRREVNLVGKGTGLYISGGKSVPITWSKKDHHTPTVFKDEGNNILHLNKGKTWICVFSKDRKVQIQ